MVSVSSTAILADASDNLGLGGVAILLFVLKPLVINQWFKQQAIKDSDNAFSWLHRMHKTVLTLSILAVLGAVVGSHGFQF